MISCSITTSFLGCLVTTYLFFRYIFRLEIAPSYKSLFFILFFLAGCIPLFVSYRLENILGPAYPYYRYALYFIYIGCIILFTLTICADVLWLAGTKAAKLAGYGTGLTPFSKIGGGRAGIIAVVTAFAAAGFSLYEGIKIPAVKTIEIRSDKIGREKTVAVLSDLHIHRTLCPEKIKGIVERTNARNPDVIVLAGDIIDDETAKVSGITSLLKGLKAPDGIYFVTGNHEFYTGYNETVEAMKNLGFAFLENNGQSVDGQFYLAGIPDLFSAKSHGIKIDPEKAFAASSEGQYRVLVSHTPADFGADNRFDLEISGHTHGGQIFPFHLFAKLHNKYLSGLYGMANNARIYVSNGAGQWGPQMRFLAPSEITIIKLMPENNLS